MTDDLSRCVITELYVGQCGHCRPSTSEPDELFSLPDLRGPWFEAGFDDFCVDCGLEIISGDLIRANGFGAYLCQECG